MPNPIEQAGVKVAGKLGGLLASLNGLTGVFRKLSEEHKQMAVLLERAVAASSPDKREDLWTTVRAELVAHERAELVHVYFEVVTPGASEDVSEAHRAEANELEALIAQIDSLAFDSSGWHRAMTGLQRVMAQHAAKEETEYFPQLQAAIGEARAKELEELYLRAKLAITYDLD